MIKTKSFWILAIFLAGIDGCHHKPPLEPPPSLVGMYTGTYSRVVQGQPDSAAVSQYITWTFTTTKYKMYYDSTQYPNEADAIVCDCGGLYAVASGITLSAETPLDSNLTARTCNRQCAPDGPYQLDQSATNKITMTGLSQNGAGMSVLKTLILTRAGS
jgi:hypothetical protein